MAGLDIGGRSRDKTPRRWAAFVDHSLGAATYCRRLLVRLPIGIDKMLARRRKQTRSDEAIECRLACITHSNAVDTAHECGAA
jgi:hypothetical protein